MKWEYFAFSSSNSLKFCCYFIANNPYRWRLFFIILNQNLKVIYQNRAFFDVTKCVWVKDKEWMVCDCILTQVIAQTARYIPKFDALFAKLCLLPNYLSSNTTVYDHTNLVWCHAATQKVLWAKRLYLLHYRRTGITTIITIVGK